MLQSWKSRLVTLGLLLFTGMLVPAGTASARPGGIFEEDSWSEGVVCRTFTTDGSLKVQARAVRTADGTDFFQIQAFETAGPGNLAFEGGGSPAEWSDGSVRGAGELFDPAGEPYPGEFVFAASFDPAGPPTTQTVRQQEGNQRVVVDITTTEYTITDPVLTVVLDGTALQLDPLDCAGDLVFTHLKSTTPATFVNNTRSLEIVTDPGCYLPGGEDVFAEVIGQRLHVTISNLQGDLWGAEGTIRLHGGSGSGSLAIVDEAGASAGTAAASATVTKIGEKSTEAFREDGFVVVQTVTPYRLDLQVALPYGSAAVSCDMQLLSQRLRIDLTP
jgi:hypothetical protein